MDRRTAAAKVLLRDMIEVTQGASMGPKNDAAISLFEPRCRVCSAGSAVKNLPNGEAVRSLVDSMLLIPASYRETLKAVEPLMERWPMNQRISYDGIRSHQKRHLPFQQWAAREIAERRAQEKGLDIMEGSSRLLTVAAVHELVADRGWKLLADGQLSPSVRETMDAAKVVGELDEAAEGQMTVEEIKLQFRQVIGAIRKHVPIQYWEAIEREVWAQGLQHHRGISAREHDADRELEEEIAAGDEG